MSEPYKRRITLRTPELVQRAIQALKDAPTGLETPLECIIRPVKSKRTLEQNAYYWKLIQDIASFTGDTTESIAVEMKSMFLMPIKEMPLPDGRVFVAYKSTADMGVRELAEFSERIEAFAISELGFVRNVQG